MLAIGVGADDHLTRMVSPGDGKPGLEGMSLSTVLLVSMHGGAMDAGQGKDFVVVGAGTIVHHENVGGGGMGSQFADQGDERVTGFVGRDENEHDVTFRSTRCRWYRVLCSSREGC